MSSELGNVHGCTDISSVLVGNFSEGAYFTQCKRTERVPTEEVTSKYSF